MLPEASQLWTLESAGGAVPLWTLKDYENELASSESRFFALEDAGRLEGFVLYRALFPEAWVMQLAVGRKGEGWGSRLMEAYLAALRAQRFESVGLEVGERNSAACALYAKFGFAVVGKRRNYYRNGDDALVMRCQLK